jgi:hypothetical protein
MYSTGYITGNGSRVRTALHEISEVVARYADKAAPRSIVTASIPLYISDSAGRRIWSPQNGVAMATFRKVDPFRVVNNFTQPNDDIADIQLGRPVGTPLNVAAGGPRENETIYIIGYPQKSEDRQQYSVPDAPGGQIRISVGEVISMETASKKQGVEPRDLTRKTKAYYRDMYVTNADGGPGLSGAPAVNARGEVIGTMTAGYPADGRASLDHVSFVSRDVR